MDDFKRIFYMIEKRPGIATGDKKISYVSHYFAGFLSEEGKFISDEYLKISNWIYEYFTNRGYNINISIWWHTMIYEVTKDEELAWNLLFEIINDYLNV